MTLNEILVILQNRMVALTEARKGAVASGDLESVVRIDGDILTTLTSIERIATTINETQ
jgi:hypothetical protein